MGWRFVALGALMFGHYLALGASTIAVSTVLSRPRSEGGLSLRLAEVTVVALAGLFGAISGPLVMKRLEARSGGRRERALALSFVCAAIGVAGLSIVIELARRQLLSTNGAFGPTPILAVAMAVAGLANGLASASVVAFVLSHLRGRETLYCRLRAVGTLGFIASGLLSGLLFTAASVGPMRLGACVFLAMAVASVLAILARARLRRSGSRDDANLADPEHLERARDVETPAPSPGVSLMAVALAIGPGFLLMVASGTVTSRFFEVFANPFLASVPSFRAPSAVQMLAQSAEVGLLLAMPWWLQSGKRGLWFILSPAAWLVLYGLFSASVTLGMPALLLIALPFQGFNCTFGTLAALRVNETLPADRRATGQSLLLASQASGSILGTLLVGVFAPEHGRRFESWLGLWPMAACAAGLSLLLTIRFVTQTRRAITETPDGGDGVRSSIPAHPHRPRAGSRSA